MRRKDAREGMHVRSRINSYYRGTYTIVKCLKTVCWVKADTGRPGIIYKGTRYGWLDPAKEQE